MINAIKQAMESQIAKHRLELLQRYPDDLAIDIRVVERFARPGMTIAWMVGDCHSHIVPLGIHQNLNHTTKYLTHLAKNDHFYVLTFSSGPKEFALSEVVRDDFPRLSNTFIPYKSLGVADAFWLHKGNSRVGSCVITREPNEANVEDVVYKIALTEVEGIDDIDRQSLQEWGDQAVFQISGTLFASRRLEWQPPINATLSLC